MHLGGLVHVITEWVIRFKHRKDPSKEEEIIRQDRFGRYLYGAFAGFPVLGFMLGKALWEADDGYEKLAFFCFLLFMMWLQHLSFEELKTAQEEGFGLQGLRSYLWAALFFGGVATFFVSQFLGAYKAVVIFIPFYVLFSGIPGAVSIFKFLNKQKD